MNRRGLLAAAAVAAVGAAAGDAWRRHREAMDYGGLWARRFARPAGGELALADLRGHPLLINFWAPWCAPCVKEMPELDRFAQQFGPRGWQVVGLAVDEMPAVRSFLQRNPIGFPVGIAGLAGVEISRGLGNKEAVLPFSAVFDSDGKLAQTRLGPTDEAELRKWASTVR